MKISERFKLGVDQYYLDFLDVDISIDSKLFINPILINKNENEWCNIVNYKLSSFFNYIIELIKGNKKGDAINI